MIHFVRATGLPRPTAVLIALAVVVGVLHHIDHVLRVDHSGWPFLPIVTPFTYSLIAYPLLLAVLFGRALPLGVRAALLIVGTAFTLWAHCAVETPAMQYGVWALGHSVDPRMPPSLNLFHLCSPGMGVASVAVSMTLNVLLVAGSLAMLRLTFGGRPARASGFAPTRDDL